MKTIAFLLTCAIGGVSALAENVLLDFEDPAESRLVVAKAGIQGAAALDGRCATSGKGSLWMGPTDGKAPGEGFLFAEVQWADSAKNDWSAAERLALDVTNGSLEERTFVFYLYDARRKKSKKARFSVTLSPQATRRVEVDLDWSEIDIDRRDVRAIAFVVHPSDFGCVFIDRVRTFAKGETVADGRPDERAFAAVLEPLAEVERAKRAEVDKVKDEEERQRAIQFRKDLEAARPRQVERLAAYVKELAAAGEDVSQMVVLQADSMRQIRPRDTDYSVLKPAKGISLRLARDEYEGAQLAVAAPGAEPLRGVRVAVENDDAAIAVTAEPIGYTLADVPLAHSFAFCEPCATNACGYVRKCRPVPLGWYADPILPFLETVDVEPGDMQGFYVRVKASSAASAGLHRCTLRVRSANAGERTVPLTVRVNGFSVGKTSELPLLVSFTPYVQPLSLSWSKAQADEVRNDPEAPVNLWRRRREDWCDMLTEYFILPGTIYPSTGDAIPDFDLLKRAAAKGRTGAVVIAPWAMVRGDEARWRRNFLEPLKRRYAAACAAGLGAQAYAYGCDETEAEHFPKVRRALEILKREAPDVPLFTTACDPKLGVGTPLADIDVFCPLTKRWEPAQVAAARAQGRKVWWYVACGETAPYANLFVQNPLCDGRLLLGAQAWRMKPDGFLYYAIAKWNQRRSLTKGPFTDWSPHGIRHRNAKAYDGDGVWTYCGPGGMPLATLRLENFRDGVEDYNYAKILERRYQAHADKDDAWAREAKRLLDVPLSVMESMSNFTDDPAAIYAWRDRMADLIGE